VLVGT